MMCQLWHTLSCIRYSQKGGEGKGITNCDTKTNILISKQIKKIKKGGNIKCQAKQVQNQLEIYCTSPTKNRNNTIQYNTTQKKISAHVDTVKQRQY